MQLPPNAHDPLFFAAALRLGEIHSHLLKAQERMDQQTTVYEQVGPGSFTRQKRTDFGKEVGQDEINWWIAKRETNLPELRERTERALAAAEVLKKRSRDLRQQHPSSYGDVVAVLRAFVEASAAEIAVLHAYVNWLYAKDPLAPSILFTYRVWGSTKRGDRRVAVKAETVQAEEPETVRRLVEVVLGLADHFGFIYERTAWEIGGDIYAANPEQEGPIEIPEDDLVRQTAWKAFGECADYFGELRDSLRNIILDIDKYNAQRDVLNSDRFWQSFLEKAVNVPMETMFWDFKETLPMWHAKGDAKEQAKIAFAEDVASFANAKGGILIVGVTDKQPRQIVGIGDDRDVENRLKVCRDVLAKHLEYERDIVMLRPIRITTGGTTRTCLAVVVAQASEDVGVRDSGGRYTYPVRRETGIARVSPVDLHSKIDPRTGQYLKADNHDFVARLVDVSDGK